MKIVWNSSVLLTFTLILPALLAGCFGAPWRYELIGVGWAVAIIQVVLHIHIGLALSRSPGAHSLVTATTYSAICYLLSGLLSFLAGEVWSGSLSDQMETGLSGSTVFALASSLGLILVKIALYRRLAAALEGIQQQPEITQGNQ